MQRNSLIGVAPGGRDLFFVFVPLTLAPAKQSPAECNKRFGYVVVKITSFGKYRSLSRLQCIDVFVA
jgi:hypothetical protein